jgi:hypothetical protein
MYPTLPTAMVKFPPLAKAGRLGNGIKVGVLIVGTVQTLMRVLVIGKSIKVTVKVKGATVDLTKRERE